MSKKSHNPGSVPPSNQQKAGTSFREPDQDESGKSAAPKCESGQPPEQRVSTNEQDSSNRQEANN